MPIPLLACPRGAEDDLRREGLAWITSQWPLALDVRPEYLHSLFFQFILCAHRHRDASAASTLVLHQRAHRVDMNGGSTAPPRSSTTTAAAPPARVLKLDVSVGAGQKVSTRDSTDGSTL